MKKLGDLLSYAIIGIAAIGWLLNLGSFINLDFQSPYRAEVFRGIGVFSPVGSVLGFININD